MSILTFCISFYQKIHCNITLTRASQAGKYTPDHQFWEKMIGIPSPIKWNCNRANVDKIFLFSHSVKISTYGIGGEGSDEIGWKPELLKVSNISLPYGFVWMRLMQ